MESTASESEREPLSVAELDRILRNAVEGATVGTWVQGEISGFKRATSGHAYFTLKDEREEAVIEAVAYRDSAMRARALLVEGARVLVRGRATVWAPRGRLQLVVESVRPAGRGALLEALEKLKRRLSAEGLFDLARKKRVPCSARFIGVVTSASGAVIHDIIRVAARRGRVRILLAPTQVQGDLAPESLVAALDRLEAVHGLDVIIIGRGGGSLEDLLAFQDERVVRRVAACRVPIVSAVGHEIDVTLTDLAADARASTPSQAAEMVVADEQAQQQQLDQYRARLARVMRARIAEDRGALDRLVLGLGDGRRLVADRQQRLDELEGRLREAARESLRRHRSGLDRWERRLVARHPRAVLERARGHLGSLQVGLQAAMRADLERRKALVGDRLGKLSALSPLAVLGRGYAIATGADGRALRDAADVREGERVGVRLSRGRLVAQVLERQEGCGNATLEGHRGS